MPHKIFRLAYHAFQKQYNKVTIKYWMTVFYRRFFAQQFKRSCAPDGPAVSRISLSSRGGWRIPSDVSAAVWMQDIETISTADKT